MEVTEKLALTITEAAELLGVSRPTMYNILHRSDFDAAFKIGSVTRVSRVKLAAWVEAQAEGRCAM